MEQQVNSGSNYFAELGSMIAWLWKREEFCDLDVYTSDSAPIKTHRIVLSAACDTFMNEIREKGSIKSLDMFTRKEILTLLDFLYTGVISHADEDFSNLLGICCKLNLSSTQNGILLDTLHERKYSKSNPHKYTCSLPMELNYQVKTSIHEERPLKQNVPLSRKDHLLRSQKNIQRDSISNQQASESNFAREEERSLMTHYITQNDIPQTMGSYHIDNRMSYSLDNRRDTKLSELDYTKNPNDSKIPPDTSFLISSLLSMPNTQDAKLDGQVRQPKLKNSNSVQSFPTFE